MHDQNRNRLQSFASLGWYDETIKFVFNFVTKTSELLLAAGVVVSTANFLTDGDIMSHNKTLSDAWSWAQALAIDSSLGIVFMNAFQALREREKIKAVIYFTLTALLAAVAGLITHFDALGHATGLPVTVVARIIPLWIMTALRAVAVIGFLLASRLKNVSFNDLHRDLVEEPRGESGQRQELQRELVIAPIDYSALATALVTAMQQAGATDDVRVAEERVAPTEPGEIDSDQSPGTPLISLRLSEAENPELAGGERAIVNRALPEVERKHRPRKTADARLSKAYEELQREGNPVTGITLSKRAGVRKQNALEWLQQLRESGDRQGPL